MKENTTAICVLVDQSGSMDVIRKGVIDGINEFLVTQKKVEGEVIFSLITFSEDYFGKLDYKTLYDFRNIKELEPLTENVYNPAGSTPLLDAMGKAINEFGAQLAVIPEAARPSKVVFVIVTDGYENASHTFTNEKIKTMTLHQENTYNWKFVYLGANQDSFAVGGGLGVQKQSTMNYQHNYAGVTGSLHALSASVASYRTGELADVILTDENKTVTPTS